jgi:hypothetical protein
MSCHFYGCDGAEKVRAKNSAYRGIETPLDLYDALSGIWCAETCAPRMRADWSPDNRTLGQCSITAFLAQDIFGGEVCGMITEGGNVHCYNDVDGHIFDLTCEQFGDKAKDLVYDGKMIQERNSPGHFMKEEKKKRYEYLKKKLSERQEKIRKAK